MDNLKLNDTICFYRKKQGLTQEELAGKLGVTNQSVSKWESAQCCPDISLIPKLADILQMMRLKVAIHSRLLFLKTVMPIHAA